MTGNRIKTNPAFLLILSFTGAILTGTILLKLPFSVQNGHISFIDSLFTSASAVCVTGLIVVDTGQCFTLFGQIVILILIQVGGIGIMTISVFLFNSLKRSMGITQRQAIQSLYSSAPRKDIQSIIYSIFAFTLIAELSGTALLYIFFKSVGTVKRPLFSAIFHSVSAFCNAGFSLFSDNFISFNNNPGICIVIMLLIIAGGIGFPVVYELVLKLVNKIKGKRSNLSLQTKTVLTTTSGLIISGAVLFFIISFNTALSGQSLTSKIINSLFQSVTCRTAGFNTLEMSKISEEGLFLLIILMFIGASPGSCGGGIKTTTISIVLSHFRSRLKNKTQTSLFKRGIPEEVVNKAFILVVMYILIIAVFSFFILFLEESCLRSEAISDSPLLSVLFEVVSALGTVGLSVGITPLLSPFCKFLIIVLMFSGRVGPLTMVYLIIGNKTQIQRNYAEENIMVG
ncbi:MAG: TrkH family potassium uptake protein [Spirochaetales bacterium]|nr:TrkH family potassium uptake protein [Spirochaetales bacterium]